CNHCSDSRNAKKPWGARYFRKQQRGWNISLAICGPAVHATECSSAAWYDATTRLEATEGAA
ncbi:hypothetical protein VitviT2T_008511, partial [Vitis vinifera]